VTEHETEALCAAVGLRLTRPRRVLLRVLREATDHPSADQIFARARAHDPAIALGTVYRNLGILEEAGIVTRHAFGEGYARYELATQQHGHIIDRDSGTVVEFTDPALETTLQAIAQARGFRLADYHVKLWGERE
jgi:Fur family ferric uptake transcriptional regulator